VEHFRWPLGLPHLKWTPAGKPFEDAAPMTKAARQAAPLSTCAQNPQNFLNKLAASRLTTNAITGHLFQASQQISPFVFALLACIHADQKGRNSNGVLRQQSLAAWRRICPLITQGVKARLDVDVHLAAVFIRYNTRAVNTLRRATQVGCAGTAILSGNLRRRCGL